MTRPMKTRPSSVIRALTILVVSTRPEPQPPWTVGAFASNWSSGPFPAYTCPRTITTLSQPFPITVG